MQHTTAYDAAFLTRNLAMARASARKVLPAIFDLAPIRTVVDVGCGRGGWLVEASALGASRCIGYDGPWVTPQDRAGQTFELRVVDLEGSVELPACDLAICLEVVEHLSPEAGESLVQALSDAAPVVLFSAAQPGQGGPGHRNERPLSTWVQEFGRFGHIAYDTVRPAVWDDAAVAWWVRQNALVFQSHDHPTIPPARLTALERPLYDVVHPEALRRAREAR